ncbi:hypothetical protein H5410_040792 [Solanum commersonii]|uniref:Uncharacterized protein n=1 Tax=Solanum commersonii TaxID=4109 RepID=A0A9J5XTL2_SOLCO|nr:hypothetical protein H5410_040792 [Solanum commersonii]
MSTHSIGHQSSGLGFATSLSGKPKTHGHQKLVQADSSCFPTTSSRSRPLGGIVLLLCRTIRRSAFCFFHCLFDSLFSGLRILKQREESVLSVNRQRFLAMLMLQLLRSFQPLCSFLCLSVHASTKTKNP